MSFMEDSTIAACGVEAELEAYAPLVRSVAWRYAGRGAEFEDLVQEGCLALIVLIVVFVFAGAAFRGVPRADSADMH